jgi:hypothetical protein
VPVEEPSTASTTEIGELKNSTSPVRAPGARFGGRYH